MWQSSFDHNEDGNIDYNDKLSLFRAGGVRLYLINKGVNREQLHVVPMSESVPILSNASFLGRKVNRRVGMTFIDIYDPIYQTAPYDSILQKINIQIQPKEDYISPYLVWEKMPLSVHFSKDNASTLTKYSRNKLDQLINYLNMVPYRLIITGYMDPNDENNDLKLPEYRAETVKNYLMMNGISDDKIIPLENANFNNQFDILSFEPGIHRRRVQFFLVKN